MWGRRLRRLRSLWRREALVLLRAGDPVWLGRRVIKGQGRRLS